MAPLNSSLPYCANDHEVSGGPYLGPNEAEKLKCSTNMVVVKIAHLLDGLTDLDRQNWQL